MPDSEEIREDAWESVDASDLVPVMAEDVAKQKRRLRIWITTAVLIVGSVAWNLYHHAVDPVDARQTYSDGVRLFRSNRYEQAILNFNRALDLQPNYVDAYRMRGRSYAAIGKPDNAIPDFTKVVQYRPHDAPAYVERGFAQLDRKSMDQALADAEAAIAADPKLSRAYNLRATVERAQGNLPKALEDFTTAVELDPNLDNLFQRGATYQQLQNHPKALADFTAALVLSPDQPHTYFARAQARMALGDIKGAQEDIAVGRKIDGW
jgi:tetratricopeptide (TPR) repeat protein